MMISRRNFLKALVVVIPIILNIPIRITDAKVVTVKKPEINKCIPYLNKWANLRGLYRLPNESDNLLRERILSNIKQRNR